MSHGLSKAGSSMVSSRGIVPWHNHESCAVVDDITSIDDGLAKAKMDWEAVKVPLFFKGADGADVDAKAFGVIRKDNGALLTDGRAVGKGYTILQNREAFAWFQPFLEQKLVKLDTAGALMGGARIWVMAVIENGTMEIAKDDPVEKFLLLSHSHDGTLAVRVGFTPVRVVCANTLAMAHGDKESKLIRVRHSGQVKANLAALRETVNVWTGEFEATAEKYRALVNKDINSADLEKYIKFVFDMKPTEKSGDKLPTRSLNIIEEIKEKFEKAPGASLKGSMGTWWGAYNAVTNYLTHDRGNSVETSLNSLWFGNSFNVNRRALDTALGVVGNQLTLVG